MLRKYEITIVLLICQINNLVSDKNHDLLKVGMTQSK